MKNAIIMILAAIMSLQLFVQCKSTKTDDPVKQSDSKITYLLYMRQGMRGNVEKKYEMEWVATENRYKVTFENYDGVKTAYAELAIGEEIAEFLRQGRVDRFQNYYDPGPRVLDGWTWKFKVKYADGTSVSSGGRMRKPSDFSGVERTESRLKMLFE